MPIFHNSGHVPVGCQEILPYFSHLELESLPTGGWGYDHYPMSAAYSRNLGLDFLGMTGKFHRTWGEFGGFKHPNALRYEWAAMLAKVPSIRASAEHPRKRQVFLRSPETFQALPQHFLKEIFRWRQQ